MRSLPFLSCSRTPDTLVSPIFLQTNDPSSSRMDVSSGRPLQVLIESASGMHRPSTELSTPVGAFKKVSSCNCECNW
ncbi:hypothetical protein ATANTOWER_020993 [Ataeniobius toweri]|uniref:Uncharacterized protein n=1 Tax=Ataeniobius toweri TaxID=208326 RepID=A0ABU7BGU1_9TELE|nr:hypothetical protein [Ataeniobius toweri]